MADCPVVTTDPQMRFGYPHIGGVSVEAIAEKVWVGESVETIADEYGITRPEVLVACWWTARYGTKRQRAQWAGWLDEVANALWHGRYDIPWYDIPDPPDRTEV